ncbi:Rpn family recombination-promoting nuclease/putative transposase [Parabacteroides segnis]|uniref:Rpn family recombination-promoting nuclease/putative transposase n=1 Tax=Parabacteroides segnis TaxID=2763058 RepID=UPI0035177E2C
MGKFINPFTDFGFHHIFGQEVHKELLIDFLNQLLKDERHIIDITFLNPIQQPETIEDRGVIFDIHCRDDKGGWFVVEMQNGAQPYFYDRGIYYLSRAISNQGEKGKDWKFSLCPVYGIFLLNYKMGINSKFRTDVILADRDTGRMFSDKIRQVYLELPWFTKEPDDCETDFERWLYLLKHMDTLERMPFKARKAVFDKLLEVADVANLSKDERILYDEALKRYRDYKNTIDYAEEKGVEKGIKIGKTEEQRLIAANLKKRGVNTEMIAQCTGLSIEEIDNL